MSPIPVIELQRRLSEAGRIRMGKKGSRGEPQRLGTWRITSPDQGLIEQAAALYGGTLAPWESPTGPQFQVTTTTPELPVIVMPGYSLRQQYEHRTSPTLVERRCDGTEMEDGTACKCAEEGEDTCVLITRLTVALPELTTLLGWRLESKGENAARELLGSLDLVRGVAAGRPFVPAKLRIVERRGNVNGQAVRYVVPVIDVAISYNELVSAHGGGDTPLTYLPAPRKVFGVGLAEGLEKAGAPALTRSTSVAAIPDQDIPFGDGPVPVPAEDSPPDTAGAQLITAAQKKKANLLVGQLRDAGHITTEQLYRALNRAVPEDPHWSPLRDSLTKDEASTLIDRLEKFSADLNASEPQFKIPEGATT